MCSTNRTTWSSERAINLAFEMFLWPERQTVGGLEACNTGGLSDWKGVNSSLRCPNSLQPNNLRWHATSLAGVASLLKSCDVHRASSHNPVWYEPGSWSLIHNCSVFWHQPNPCFSLLAISLRQAPSAVTVYQARWYTGVHVFCIVFCPTSSAPADSLAGRLGHSAASVKAPA